LSFTVTKYLNQCFTCFCYTMVHCISTSFRGRNWALKLPLFLQEYMYQATRISIPVVLLTLWN